MDRKKIEELKKILSSKIDQLLVLIGDSSKVVHFDIFKINNSNLDESLIKIRKIFENNPGEDLEVLVMKKDLIKLTEDFLKKDLLEDLKKEEKKLRKVRYIYLTILIVFTFIGVLFYSGLLKSLLISVFSTKQIVYKQKLVYTGCKLSYNSGNNIKSDITGDLLKINQNNTGNSVSGDIYTGGISTGSISTGDKLIVNSNYSGNNYSGSVVSGGLINTGSKLNLLAKKYETISGDFVLFVINTGTISSGNVFSGIVQKQKILRSEIIKLIGFKTGVDLKKSKAMILSFSGNQVFSGSKYNVLAYLSGTITGDIIIGKLRKVSLYKEKVEPIFDVDINYKILKGKQLEDYKKEKKQACPYTGYIYVSVRALNLRQKATKYSKRVVLLRKGAKLKVLGCQKNLKSDSWWYKVYVPKLKLEGWVSTIGVSK